MATQKTGLDDTGYSDTRRYSGARDMPESSSEGYASRFGEGARYIEVLSPGPGLLSPLPIVTVGSGNESPSPGSPGPGWVPVVGKGSSSEGYASRLGEPGLLPGQETECLSPFSPFSPLGLPPSLVGIRLAEQPLAGASDVPETGDEEPGTATQKSKRNDVE